MLYDCTFVSLYSVAHVFYWFGFVLGILILSTLAGYGLINVLTVDSLTDAEVSSLGFHIYLCHHHYKTHMTNYNIRNSVSITGYILVILKSQ